jgi:hypothetical protein
MFNNWYLDQSKEGSVVSHQNRIDIKIGDIKDLIEDAFDAILEPSLQIAHHFISCMFYYV